jgi:hypothetical protein
MEISRSYLVNVISFYFMLHLPSIDSYDDAIRLWSNRYKTSELKAVLHLVAELAACHGLKSTTRDKAKFIEILGSYIKRIDIKNRRSFVDPSNDSTHCARANIILKIDAARPSAGMKDFYDQFIDVEKCRSQCRIGNTILERHRSSVEAYVRYAETLPPNEETRGFLKVCENLKEILRRGASALSCKTCEKIGDAVIALDASRNMNLDHIDRSFDLLCCLIGQSHVRHPSESAVMTSV